MNMDMNVYLELEKLGLVEKEAINIEEIRSQNGVNVYRVSHQGSFYVLKCFDKEEFTREIENYSILNELGIQTIKTFGNTDRAILLEDIDKSEDYRLGIKEDMSDKVVARSLAKWYIQLHERGQEYLTSCGSNVKFYREIDSITQDNIKKVMEKSNTKDNRVWISILSNIDLIIEKTKALGETLTYNDFYFTNFVVKKDKTEAFMFDYNLLGIGLRYFDIRNVTSSMSKEAGEVFISEYGNYNMDEKVLDDFLGIVFTLITAYEREKFPKWAEEALKAIDNGELEKAFKNVMELSFMS